MKLAVPLTLFLVFHPSSEFRVNTTTTGDQLAPSVAAGAYGSFVVAWHSYGNAGDDHAGIFAKRVTSASPEIHVNTYTTGFQQHASVAVDALGNFVVAWDSAEDGSFSSVVARRFDADTAPRGAAFRVNTITSGIQHLPAAAITPSGGFLIAFDGVDADSRGAFARRYLGNGIPLGAEFQVNVTTTREETFPFVAVDASGAFVVTWTGKSQDGGGYDIFARRFGPDGTSRGTEFRVNTVTTGSQYYSKVSVNPAGAFVVAWSTTDLFPGAERISARAYRADGSAQTGEITVNLHAARVNPAALSLPDGGFVVVYSGYRQEVPDASADIFLRHFDAAGTPIGSELVVNTYTTGAQTSPAIAAHPRGFIVVWESDGQDGSGRGIYARGFTEEPVPGDMDGDGDVTVADVFYLINFLFAAGPAPVG